MAITNISRQGVSAWGQGVGGDYTLVSNDYSYHLFTSTDVFTVLKAGYFDLLIVSGGGGAGPINGSIPTIPGGGGGIRYQRKRFLDSGEITITVGAGGSAGGNAGGDSKAGEGNTGGQGETESPVGAVGGGTGSGTGACGGGSSGKGVIGYDGGAGAYWVYSGEGTGGGGGMGAVGQNGVGGYSIWGGPAQRAGEGGDGINDFASWLTLFSGQVTLGDQGYLCGGGGGGGSFSGKAQAFGGSGGGGFGAQQGNNPTAGGTLTGGGGGGAPQGVAGEAGGSGFVIIRYNLLGSLSN